MECSKPTAWTTNRSLLVASLAKAFPGRPTNSDSTLPRAVHLEGCVNRSHQCFHFAFAKYSGITRHTTNPSGFVLHAKHPPPPSVPIHPAHHSHDQLRTCINCVYRVHLSSAALALLESSSGALVMQQQ